MPVFQYLRLDATNDPVLIPQASLVDLQAVAQAILTRLKLFQGEWWENLAEGTPMFQSILGHSGSSSNQVVMTNLLNARILGTPYVSSVEVTTSKFDSKTRKFTYAANVQTAFGTIPVVIAPGASAVVVG